VYVLPPIAFFLEKPRWMGTQFHPLWIGKAGEGLKRKQSFSPAWKAQQNFVALSARDPEDTPVVP
jgi:hypothetical protein